MERTRIWRRRDEIYRARLAWVANVGDRKAIAEHVADKGMPLMDHDLHAVAAAVLVGVTDEFNIARRDRDHTAPPRAVLRKRAITCRSPGPQVFSWIASDSPMFASLGWRCNFVEGKAASFGADSGDGNRGDRDHDGDHRENYVE